MTASAAAGIAHELFAATLAEIDVERVIHRSVECDGSAIRVMDTVVELDSIERVFVVALGKAARPLARALHDVLAAAVPRPIEGIVVSRRTGRGDLPARFAQYRAGHPIPDAASLVAGRAVLRAVAAADSPTTLIVFAISGGASAMCENLLAHDVTLDELRATNEWLVTCGARIAEINAIRRALSAVKGGRLAATAPRSRQLTLLVSDVNPGDECNVGSGPTVVPRSDVDARDVIASYRLESRLPASVVTCLEAEWPEVCVPSAPVVTLSDNARAVAGALRYAERVFDVHVAVVDSPVEAPVDDVARDLVERAARCRDATILIGGGEAVCPVRGVGRGGRNQETALRAARYLGDVRGDADVAVLSAGTDGIDGNSPAAGACADRTTMQRAATSGMRAARFLASSDSYEYFAALGDTILTGPIENNVRDLRIAVAIPRGVIASRR